MAEDASRRIRRGDAFLRQTSWDGTWNRIRSLMDELVDDAAGDPAGTSEPAEDATAV